MHTQSLLKICLAASLAFSLIPGLVATPVKKKVFSQRQPRKHHHKQSPPVSSNASLAEQGRRLLEPAPPAPPPPDSPWEEELKKSPGHELNILRNYALKQSETTTDGKAVGAKGPTGSHTVPQGSIKFFPLHPRDKLLYATDLLNGGTVIIVYSFQGLVIQHAVEKQQNIDVLTNSDLTRSTITNQLDHQLSDSATKTVLGVNPRMIVIHDCANNCKGLDDLRAFFSGKGFSVQGDHLRSVSYNKGRAVTEGPQDGNFGKVVATWIGATNQGLLHMRINANSALASYNTTYDCVGNEIP